MLIPHHVVNKVVFTLVALVLLTYIGIRFPVQLPVVVFKASLVTLAAIIGYWLDYTLNYMKIIAYKKTLDTESLTLETERILMIGASISRSILIFACILGMSLAV